MSNVNRNPIRPGQMYAECEECGVFARGGSRRLVLKHLPGCSKAEPAATPTTTPATVLDDDPPPASG